MDIQRRLRDPQGMAMEELQPGDHVCGIYRDEDEHASLLAGFVESGLKRGHRVVSAVQESVRRPFYAELTSRGIQPEPRLSDEQLVLLTPEQFYLREDGFAVAPIIQTLRDMAREARNDNYEGLHASGCMPPELFRRIDTEKLLKYEARVDEALAETGAVGLCRYDRRGLPPDYIRRVLPTHPIVGVGSCLYHNFYYTCPGSRTREDRTDDELQRWIDNLIQYDRLQRHLRRTGNRYRAIFENSGTGIAIIEPDTTISLINREFERLTGYSKEDVEGTISWRKLVAPEDREKMMEYHRRRREERDDVPASYEFRFVRKDGEVRHGIIRVQVIPGSEQSMVSVIDITERKRAQEKLKESEREKALILESSPAHIVYQNLNHDILWANRGAARSVNLTKDDLQGRKCYEVWHDRAEPCPDCPVRRAQETGRECEGEIVDKNDNVYIITGKPTWDEDGNMTGVVETSLQINEQKNMEKKLRESRRKLRALTERLQSLREDERRRLSRKIHDELGHQLTAMKIDLSRMKKEVGGGEDRTEDSSLQKRLDDMSGLVNEAIESVHQVASQLRPDALDDLGLEAVLQSEIERFQQRTGIKTALYCSAETSKLDEASATALFRVSQELLSNVARHAEASRVRVELKEEGDDIRLRVIDNGCGISPEEVAGDDSLGILGVRERIRALGGRVSIEGEPGEKTVAAVQVPLIGDGSRDGETMQDARTG